MTETNLFTDVSTVQERRHSYQGFTGGNFYHSQQAYKVGIIIPAILRWEPEAFTQELAGPPSDAPLD